MRVAERLEAAASVPGMELLGVHHEDRETLRRWLLAIAADPAERDRVAALCRDVLLPGLGDYDDAAGGPGFPAHTTEHPLGAGVLPLCALAAFAPDVAAHLTRRGVPEAVAARTLHDLGQQVAKHRRVHGVAGLHNQDWLRTVWSGGFFWVGRLQFEITRSDLGCSGAPRRVLAVHVPQTGPLTPEDVDAAFASALQIARSCYPDAGRPAALICHSWLLDPALATLLPGSNIARFGARWDVWARANGDRDALYFGFDAAPGASAPAASTAARSRLHAALIAHWAAGGHLRTCTGKIPLGPDGTVPDRPTKEAPCTAP